MNVDNTICLSCGWIGARIDTWVLEKYSSNAPESKCPTCGYGTLSELDEKHMVNRVINLRMKKIEDRLTQLEKRLK